MPSLTTLAGMKVADTYREAGFTPFIEPAFETPAPTAAGDDSEDSRPRRARLLAGIPLAARLPLDYLHMVGVSSALQLYAAMLSQSW
jgi:hypothetical protein